jgi:hypothetical protein
MARWLIGAIGAVLLVVLPILWLGLGRRAQPGEEPVAATEAKPPASIESVLVELVPFDSRPPPAVPSPPDSSVPPAPPSADRDRSSDLQEEQTRKFLELLRPKAVGPLGLLKRVYRTESRDVTSRDTERFIRNEFGRGTIPVDALQNVTCHTSACRIDLFWTERNRTVMGGQMAVDPAPGPDRLGRLPVALYIVRRGHDLVQDR